MRLYKTLACSLLFGLLAVPAMAAQAPIAKVIAFAPTVEAVNAEGTRALAMKAPVFEHDELRTGEKGMVQLIFNDDSTMTLDAESSASMQDFACNGSSSDTLKVHVGRGLLRMVTGEVVRRNPNGFAVTTPHSTIGIRGTGFSVAVSPERTVVSAFQLSAGLPILVRNDSTGATALITKTDMAVEVTPEGIREVELSELEAVKAQFVAREPLGGAANGANPNDGLQAGNGLEDSLLDKDEPQILADSSSNEPVVPDEPVVPVETPISVSIDLGGAGMKSTIDGKTVSWNEGSLEFDATLSSAIDTVAFSGGTLNMSGAASELDENLYVTVEGEGGTGNVYGNGSSFDINFDALTGEFSNASGTGGAIDSANSSAFFKGDLAAGDNNEYTGSITESQINVLPVYTPITVTADLGRAGMNSTIGDSQVAWNSGTLQFGATLSSASDTVAFSGGTFSLSGSSVESNSPFRVAINGTSGTGSLYNNGGSYSVNFGSGAITGTFMDSDGATVTGSVQSENSSASFTDTLKQGEGNDVYVGDFENFEYELNVIPTLTRIAVTADLTGLPVSVSGLNSSLTATGGTLTFNADLDPTVDTVTVNDATFLMSNDTNATATFAIAGSGGTGSVSGHGSSFNFDFSSDASVLTGSVTLGGVKSPVSNGGGSTANFSGSIDASYKGTVEESSVTLVPETVVSVSSNLLGMSADAETSDWSGSMNFTGNLTTGVLSDGALSLARANDSSSFTTSGFGGSIAGETFTIAGALGVDSNDVLGGAAITGATANLQGSFAAGTTAGSYGVTGFLDANTITLTSGGTPLDITLSIPQQ